MDDLTSILRSRIAEYLGGHQTLVWYDPGGALSSLVEGATPEGVRLLRYEGSYLELRITIEELDPELHGNWLIYVPEDPPKPSWLRDYELSGKMVKLSLPDVLSKDLHLAFDGRLRTLLAGTAGKKLVTRWNELIGPNRSIDSSVLSQAMLAAVLDLLTLDMKDILISYVSEASAPEQLHRAGLDSEFRKLLSDAGLVDLPDGTVPPDRIAEALLLSEFVEKSGFTFEEISRALPKVATLRQWSNWLEAWSREREEGFAQQATRVERQFRIKEKISALQCLGVHSFPCVDDLLLQEIRDLAAKDLSKSTLRTLQKIVVHRSDTVWAKRRRAEGRPLPWDAMLAGLDVIEIAEIVQEKLKNKHPTEFGDVFEPYAAESGWWRADDAFRRFDAQRGSVDGELDLTIGQHIRSAYGAFLDCLSRTLAGMLKEGCKWGVKKWLDQGDAWKHLVQGHDKTVVILADALRYDLAISLVRALEKEGIQVEKVPTLGRLPSVTEIGMGCLLPASESRQLAVDASGLGLRIGETVLGTRQERLDYLKGKVQNVTSRRLEEIKEGQIPSPNQLLVIFAREVDEQGEFLPKTGIDYFLELVKLLRVTIVRLLEAGYLRVVVLSDHGFMLLPDGWETVVIGPVQSDNHTARGRRYAVGKPSEVAGTIRAPESNLGFRGSLTVMFPSTLAVFSGPGRPPRFLHGGPLPAEVALLSMVCKAGESLKEPVKVAIVGPDRIDTLRPRITLLSMQPETLLAKVRRVRVEMLLGTSRVASSEAVTFTEIGERIEVQVKLASYGNKMVVQIVDVDNDEIIAKREIQVTLPGGYEEFG